MLPAGCIGFFFFVNIFVGPRSILLSHLLRPFWNSCDPPHGFQSQGGLSPAILLACLLAVILRVMSSTTPAFSSNRGVRYKCVYSRLTFQTSLTPAKEERQHWDTNPGSPWVPDLQATTRLRGVTFFLQVYLQEIFSLKGY